jgi:hypothetical protein
MQMEFPVKNARSLSNQRGGEELPREKLRIHKDNYKKTKRTSKPEFKHLISSGFDVQIEF